MGTRQVDLSVLTFTSGDLSRLPSHLAAFLAGTSLAVNDMQILRRSQLLITNAVKRTKKQSSVELLALLQSLTEDRLLSARLFEYIKFYERFTSEYGFEGAVDTATASALKSLAALKEGRGFDVARWMRNKITNHLDIEEAIKIVRQIAAGETFSLMLHETQWNTWHPLGDQILSYYGLQKFGDQGASLAAWQQWIDATHEWTLQTHNEFVIAVLEQYLPEKVAVEQREFVDETLVGTPSTSALPLFFVAEDGMDR